MHIVICRQWADPLCAENLTTLPVYADVGRLIFLPAASIRTKVMVVENTISSTPVSISAAKTEIAYWYGCVSDPFSLSTHAENSPLLDSLLEFHGIHGNRHEIAAGKILTCRDPGSFIHPLQQIAAEEKAAMVKVFRKNELVIFHVFPEVLTALILRSICVRRTSPMCSPLSVLR